MAHENLIRLRVLVLGHETVRVRLDYCNIRLSFGRWGRPLRFEFLKSHADLDRARDVDYTR